jgi:hypothetical protein
MAFNFETWLSIPDEVAADLETESKFLDAAFSAWARFDPADLPLRTEAERRRHKRHGLIGLSEVRRAARRSG